MRSGTSSSKPPAFPETKGIGAGDDVSGAPELMSHSRNALARRPSARAAGTPTSAGERRANRGATRGRRVLPWAHLGRIRGLVRHDGPKALPALTCANAESWRRDSNPQPPVYKTGALPIAPLQQDADFPREAASVGDALYPRKANVTTPKPHGKAHLARQPPRPQAPPAAPTRARHPTSRDPTRRREGRPGPATPHQPRPETAKSPRGSAPAASLTAGTSTRSPGRTTGPTSGCPGPPRPRGTGPRPATPPDRRPPVAHPASVSLPG